MRLSTTELKVLEELALGRSSASDIAQALIKDRSQVYRIIRGLEEKGFAKLENGIVAPSEKTHVRILLQELSAHSSIIVHLSGCGIELSTTILEPKSIGDIVAQTGIKRSTVFSKIKRALGNSFIRKQEKKYVFNEKIWPAAREFIRELRAYEATTDRRLPPGSVIYYKTEEEIVFSTKVACDATITGFSAYEDYGIRLLTIDYSYYLPKKKLTMQEVFQHSLYRAQSTGDSRDIMFIALFYLKHKKRLGMIHHEIIDNIKNIVKGERIKKYPTLPEIKDRADVYDIKI